MSLSTYRVAARRVAPDISTGSTRNAEIRFDTGAALSEDLFGPADLLAAAFAACMLKNVERFSGILPFRYDDAAVDVTLEREERPPRITRITYELRLATDEPPGRVDLLRRNLTQFGTIYNTLAQVCTVSGEIVVEPRN